MCECKDVEIGSYANQISLKCPLHMQKYRERKVVKGYAYGIESHYISIDKCIANEIIQLWDLGITTTGCCCGHNKQDGYVGVIENDISKMIELGYKPQKNILYPEDKTNFYLKEKI